MKRPHWPAAARRFWRVSMEANLTGQSAMIAYNMLLAVIPIALVALFIAGQVLVSGAVERSMLSDLRQLFPGAAEHTLDALLRQIKNSTTSTGVLALIASLWLGSSFWGSLDTAFSHVYGCRPRRWIEQKRFGFVMVGVVLLFMVATVAVPTVQSLLVSGAKQLPLGLDDVPGLVYAISLVGGLTLLFGCLTLIYSRVPNRPIQWPAVWPGALGATLMIGVIDYAFPAYLSNISTIARFGTTIVFLLIVLGWFYVLALIILAGAVVNSMRLEAAPASGNREVAVPFGAAPLVLGQLVLPDRGDERDVPADRAPLDSPPPQPERLHRRAGDPDRGEEVTLPAPDHDVGSHREPT